MKGAELLRLLQHDGWYVIRQSGSHAIMQHDGKPGRLTVPVHQSKEIKKGLLISILKQAQIETKKR